MISFFNIRTGEERSFGAETEANARQAQIAAFLNSSDIGANSDRGQDFGWRLAPELAVEMDRIKQDINTLQNISRNIGVPVDELRPHHLLNYIADQDIAVERMAKANMAGGDNAYQTAYEARLQALKGEKPKDETPAVQPVETVSPMAEMPPIVEETTTNTTEAPKKAAAPKKKK